jgi:hypothetical protein
MAARVGKAKILNRVKPPTKETQIWGETTNQGTGVAQASWRVGGRGRRIVGCESPTPDGNEKKRKWRKERSEEMRMG